MRRQIVFQPFAEFAEELGIVRADFFLQLAERGLERRFAFVDAALRHLPAFDRLVDALADEHQPLAIEQHHADAGPVRQILVTQSETLTGHIADRLLRMRNYGRSGHQNKAPAGKTLRPLGHPLDGHGIKETDAGRTPIESRTRLEFRKSLIDFHRGLDRVDSGRTLDIRRIEPLRDIGRCGARGGPLSKKKSPRRARNVMTGSSESGSPRKRPPRRLVTPA
jgi:hypothetical protein